MNICVFNKEKWRYGTRSILTWSETVKIDRAVNFDLVRAGQNVPASVSPQLLKKIETLDLLYGHYNELTL